MLCAAVKAVFLTLWIMGCHGHSSDERWVLMLWIKSEQFLIPAVAQERVWSLVSPNPVFLVRWGSEECCLMKGRCSDDEPDRQTSLLALTLTPVQYLSWWVQTPSVSQHALGTEGHMALQLCLIVLIWGQTVCWCQEHLVYFTRVHAGGFNASDVSPKTQVLLS